MVELLNFVTISTHFEGVKYVGAASLKQKKRDFDYPVTYLNEYECRLIYLENYRETCHSCESGNL